MFMLLFITNVNKQIREIERKNPATYIYIWGVSDQFRGMFPRSVFVLCCRNTHGTWARDKGLTFPRVSIFIILSILCQVACLTAAGQFRIIRGGDIMRYHLRAQTLV